MSSNQEAESLEKTLETTLEKTDFGHIINENKRAILIIAAIVVVLIVGYSVMDTVQSNKRAQRLDEIFQLEKTVFLSYLDGKSDDNAFKQAFNGISNEFIAEPNLVPSMVKALNKLETNKALESTTLDKVGVWLSKMDKKNNLYVLAAMRISALYENHAQNDKAIDLLAGMLANNTEFMQDQIHFNLGRLYKLKGDSVKAKEHFTVVANLKEESEFTNMAKIYLSEL